MSWQLQLNNVLKTLKVSVFATSHTVQIVSYEDETGKSIKNWEFQNNPLGTVVWLHTFNTWSSWLGNLHPSRPPSPAHGVDPKEVSHHWCWSHTNLQSAVEPLLEQQLHVVVQVETSSWTSQKTPRSPTAQQFPEESGCGQHPERLDAHLEKPRLEGSGAFLGQTLHEAWSSLAPSSSRPRSPTLWNEWWLANPWVKSSQSNPSTWQSPNTEEGTRHPPSGSQQRLC